MLFAICSPADVTNVTDLSVHGKSMQDKDLSFGRRVTFPYFGFLAPRPHQRHVMLDHLQKPNSRLRRPAFSATRSYQKTSDSSALQAIPPTPDSASARKMCVVDFRSGEAVIRHPDLKCFLSDGWCIESAVPQIAGETVELVVVLNKSGAQDLISADEDDL